MDRDNKGKKIPVAAIRRLSIYLQVLSNLQEKGAREVSSETLGCESGYSANQVRKDISYFGECGTAGVGYDLHSLKTYIQRALGTDRVWNMALVGVGNLGSALLVYPGFRERGFNIVAAFDKDLLKIGKRLGDIKVENMSQLPRLVKEKNIQIGIVAVPGESAQSVVDNMVNSGIRAILNFAPAVVSVPEQVKLQNADLSLELEILSYFLASHDKSHREIDG